jgi:hypothetical protein
MLLFTCHEHIFDIFRRMEVDVRTLPTNRERGQVLSRSLFEPTPYIEPVAVEEEEPEIPEPEFGAIESFEPEAAPEPEPEPEVVLEEEPEFKRKHPFHARSIRKKRRDLLFGPPAPEPEKAPEPELTLEPEPVVELPVLEAPPEPVVVREIPRPRGFRLVPADWAIRANKTIVERDIRLADLALESDSPMAATADAPAADGPVAGTDKAETEASFDAFADAELDEPVVEIDEDPFEAFPAATLTWGQPSETWNDRSDDLP